MQAYIGIITIVLLICMVIFRVLSLKQQGIEAIEFGKKDPKDYFIPPFAVFYLYLILANAFDLPTIIHQNLFENQTMAWIGVLFCLMSLSLFLWALISFKKSFRVGLAENSSHGLITQGAFAVSRNPIYVSFAAMLIGQFLIFPSWILLIYIFAGILTFHRQILKEENFLAIQYGDEFEQYCGKVNRYL